MTYKITEYTYRQAKRIGVEIKPSSDPRKKVDVYKDGELIARIGGVRANGVPYLDYPTILQGERLGKYPRYTSSVRRSLYKKRHAKDIRTEWTPGWLAWNLLWN
jgi:hypothetical protein